MRNFEDAIKDRAKSLGFCLVGITGAEAMALADIEYFKRWLADGRCGRMDWLRRNVEKRFSPSLLFRGAKSVISVGLNYKPPLKAPSPIASYALYPDYHKFIKDRLFSLAAFIKSQLYSGLKFKACVDTAPLAERALAVRAGLGFIGKNHLLTNPDFGSFLLLGELITNIELKPDKPLKKKDYCGRCTDCIDACPAGALGDDFSFDADRCISYLTIEHKGEISGGFCGKKNSQVFGCDRCLFACRYNKSAPVCSTDGFTLSAERAALTPQDILSMDDSDFEDLFSGTAVFRTGLEQLKRNAGFL